MLKFKGEKTEQLTINVIDYQFPFIEDSEFDSNWLLVDVKFKSDNGTWNGRLPALLTWELEELIVWLETIKLDKKPNTNSLEFLEPNIRISLIDSTDLGSLIKIEIHDKELKDGKLDFISFNNTQDIDNLINELKGVINRLPKRATYMLESRGDMIPYFVGIVNGQKKWEYRDEYNKTVEGPFDEQCFFRNKFVQIKRNGKYGAINFLNELIVPVKYDHLTVSQGSKIRVGIITDGKMQFGLYNPMGSRVLPTHFEWIEIGQTIDIAARFDDTRQYFYDENGKLKFIMEELFPMPYSFKEGFCCVYKNNYDDSRFCAFVDESGDLICDFIYELGSRFSEGYASVKKNGYFGLIDEQGNEVFPFQYDYITNFQNGYALVKKNGKYGLINRKLNFITDVEYDSISSYKEGKFMMVLEGVPGYIDSRGEIFLYRKRKIG